MVLYAIACRVEVTFYNWSSDGGKGLWGHYGMLSGSERSYGFEAAVEWEKGENRRPSI